MVTRAVQIASWEAAEQKEHSLCNEIALALNYKIMTTVSFVKRLTRVSHGVADKDTPLQD